MKALLIGTPETLRAARAQLLLAEAGPRLAGCVLVPDPSSAARIDLTDLPVVGSIDGLAAAKRSTGATVAVVCLPASMTGVIRSVRDDLRRLGLTERFLPPIGEVLAAAPPYAVGLAGPAAGPAGWAAPRIDPAALIGRDPRPLDREAVARVLAGKRVLITGAGGSIGSELARVAASFDPASLVLMDRAENPLFEVDRAIAARFPRVTRRAVLHDVVEADQTLRHLVDLRPEVIFHAAAHKHVPLMEDHPSHAVTNNLFGTKSIADAALAVGAERFVLVSTDKAVNPASVMGATKRLAELYVRGLHARAHAGADGRATAFGMVRFGNVLGSAASVVQVWNAQLAEGGPITVTDPRMTRFFMTIPEAASLVARAAGLADHGPAAAVHVLDMGEPVRILDLAERFVRLHGYEPRVPGGPGAGQPDPRGASWYAIPAIDIVFTGVRPGEKLHEELAYSAEQLTATDAPGIHAWRGGAPGTAEVASMIADLSAVRSAADRPAVLAAIRRHVPEMAA